jgi:hypothetical protein
MSGVVNIPPEGVAMIRGVADVIRQRGALPSYWDVLYEVAKKMMGRPPIVLHNPFTGAIFWMEGMDNLTAEEFAQIAGASEGAPEGVIA